MLFQKLGPEPESPNDDQPVVGEASYMSAYTAIERYRMISTHITYRW